MNLLKINEKLTKGMIGIFISIFLLTLLAIVLPMITYIIAGLLYLLMALVAVTFVLSSYLIVKQMNKAIEVMFTQFLENERKKQQHQ